MAKRPLPSRVKLKTDSRAAVDDILAAVRRLSASDQQLLAVELLASPDTNLSALRKTADTLAEMVTRAKRQRAKPKRGAPTTKAGRNREWWLLHRRGKTIGEIAMDAFNGDDSDSSQSKIKKGIARYQEKITLRLPCSQSTRWAIDEANRAAIESYKTKRIKRRT